ISEGDDHRGRNHEDPGCINIDIVQKKKKGGITNGKDDQRNNAGVYRKSGAQISGGKSGRKYPEADELCGPAHAEGLVHRAEERDQESDHGEEQLVSADLKAV